ncbi:MAG: aspartate-semialdehyde dehydrogenase [Candidatus Moranbacteria bacterium]|nr:aspartate-semialdehyde dehydrogenase [Candidatus Moranbacteria bacterium]
MEKIKVGILGATGMVGQNYIKLLKNHPWFEISYLAASENSANKTYEQAVRGRWQMDTPLEDKIKKIIVGNVSDISKAKGKCRFVFSAFEISDKEQIRKIENEYAKNDIPVVSNASAHRKTKDVPMLIPEINPEHLDIIKIQQKNNGWNKGFVAVKPNCSLQSYLTAVYALMQKGYKVKKMFISTLQALSGAGYPGVASLDICDNVLPFISGEEEKSEQEPLKILGEIKDNKFENFQGLEISAHCNRVPVVDGHLACVSLLFGDKKPKKQEIKKIWKNFKALPQKLDLPFAPKQPIIYNKEENRPQPRKDRDNDKGMALTVGRLRQCNIFDIRFSALSHNTIRGAAGGGILNAELLVKKGYIK